MSSLNPLMTLVSLLLALAATEPLPAQDFYVPDTVSEEAKAIIRSFSRAKRDAFIAPAPDDREGWKKFQAAYDQGRMAGNEAIVKEYEPTLIPKKLGGVPVVDIRPKGWKDNGKVLVYTHGGGYVGVHANTSYTCSVPMAHDTGLRVVSVDYTLAPFAMYEQVTDEVVSVIQALIKDGYRLWDIGIMGDSAGGSLAAAVALKLRDKGLGLLGAAVLRSPWSDIAEVGDTYFTLKDQEPMDLYSKVLDSAAKAYADPKDHKNPYVSPVYGDFSKGFPPTLIQVGTKEILLSCAVRLYQAIDTAGQVAKLDVYEGMWHIFQTSKTPEAQLARKKSAAFLKEYLKY